MEEHQSIVPKYRPQSSTINAATPLLAHGKSLLYVKQPSSAEESISESQRPLEYQLRQLGSNNQLFVSPNADDGTCFAVNHRSVMGAWTSKPHITLERVSPGKENQIVATVKFNPTPNQLPWTPKALVTYAERGSAEIMEMREPWTSKWNVKIEGRECTWLLSNITPTLILTPTDDDSCTLATFTWGLHGNRSQKGREIGILRILETKSGDDHRIQILTTAAAVVAHWKSMGKFLY